MATITGYRVHYNLQTKIASITLGYPNNIWAQQPIKFKNLDEYRAVLDLLRNEKPVFYKDGFIYTGPEPQGEEES